MHGRIDLLTLNVTAAGAITRGKCVGFDGIQVAADDAAVLGQALTDQVTGKEVAVQVMGVAVFRGDGAIARGARVMSSADGDVKAAGATPANAIGRALNASADQEFVRVLLGA